MEMTDHTRQATNVFLHHGEDNAQEHGHRRRSTPRSGTTGPSSGRRRASPPTSTASRGGTPTTPPPSRPARCTCASSSTGSPRTAAARSSRRRCRSTGCASTRSTPHLGQVGHARRHHGHVRVMTAPSAEPRLLGPYSRCVPESPTAVTQSADPNPPPPPGLRRSAVIALAVGDGRRAGRDRGHGGAQGQRRWRRRCRATSNITPRNTATINPEARSDTEAAVRYGWQLHAHDEFDGNALGPAWTPYSGETTGGVGRHDPANLTWATAR